MFKFSALLFIAPMAAFAAETMPLTYESFEVSVPHVDLADCPENLAAEAVFCRATLASDAIHVFVFSEEGDLPLVNFASFEVDALSGLLK